MFALILLNSSLSSTKSLSPLYLSVNSSPCWLTFVPTFAFWAARKLGFLFHGPRTWSTKYTNPNDTWILQSCVEWSLVYRSCSSWLDQTEYQLFNHWSFLAFSFGVTCPSSNRSFTIPWLSDSEAWRLNDGIFTTNPGKIVSTNSGPVNLNEPNVIETNNLGYSQDRFSDPLRSFTAFL